MYSIFPHFVGLTTYICSSPIDDDVDRRRNSNILTIKTCDGSTKHFFERERRTLTYEIHKHLQNATLRSVAAVDLMLSYQCHLIRNCQLPVLFWATDVCLRKLFFYFVNSSILGYLLGICQALTSISIYDDYTYIFA